MNPNRNAIERQYAVGDLIQRIRGALETAGKRLTALTPNDLAPVDEFHVRGREATEELARLANIVRDSRVLDVGSGLGGSARFLANEYGCRVTGLDLTPEFCDVARELSAWTGMTDRVEFRVGDALNMPFADAEFDVVWSEHVQMNIQDKSRWAGELGRVLRPGGKIALHEIFRGEAPKPHFPVPWADVASVSFLADAEEVRNAFESTGLKTLAWRDTSEETSKWFEETISKLSTSGPPPVGLHLLMGDRALVKKGNVGRNLAEGRIRFYQGVLEKPA